MIEAPRDWVADWDKGHQFGLCVMFYPRGTSFDRAPVVLYPNLVTTEELLGPFIDGDLERFKRAGASVKAEAPSKEGLRFEVRRLEGGPPPNEQELIGYHAADHGMLLAVMSARTSRQLGQFESAFRAFLQTVEAVPRGRLYPTLVTLAAADLKKPGGAAYEKEFLRAAGPRLSAAMQSCYKQPSQGFEAVLQIAASGAVAGWIGDSPDPVGQCVRARLTQGPPPPFAPFHLRLIMKVN